MNLHDPDDFECAVEEVLRGIKDRENSREITRKAAEKELGGNLSAILLNKILKTHGKRKTQKTLLN